MVGKKIWPAKIPQDVGRVLSTRGGHWRHQEKAPGQRGGARLPSPKKKEALPSPLPGASPIFQNCDRRLSLAQF